MATRVEINETVWAASPSSGQLRAVNGAAVTITDHTTGDEVPVYAAATGGTELTQPLTTVNGRIEGWLERGTVDITATLGAETYEQFAVPVIPESAITDVETALSTKANSSSLAGKQSTSEKGQADGYAGLGSDGKVPSAQLPSQSSSAVSDRDQLGVTQAAVNTSGQALNPFFCRFGFIVAAGGLTDPILTFGQYKMGGTGGEAVIGNDGVYKVGVEYNGAFYPAYWADGSRTKTIIDGCSADCVVPGLDAPAAATIFTRVYYTGASWPRNDLVGSVAGTSYGGADVVDATGNAGLSDLVGGQGIAPVNVRGSRSGQAVNWAIIDGDSISHGTGDTVKNRGYIRYALSGASIASLSTGTDSEKGSTFATSGNRRRLLAKNAPIGFEEYANNDIFGGDSHATVAAMRVAIWSSLKYRGVKKVFAVTCTPRTTSSDSWATVGNQTAVNSGFETVRITHNTWLRAGAPLDPTTLAPVAVGTSGAVKTNVYDPSTGALTVTASGVGHPLAGIFDPTALAESAVDSGKWKAAYTTDGIHPNATAVAAMAAAIKTSVLV